MTAGMSGTTGKQRQKRCRTTAPSRVLAAVPSSSTASTATPFTSDPRVPIPRDCRRIVLVNPTRFLGNLLIAGQLIQCFERYCRHNRIELMLVLDASFRDLCEHAFPDSHLVWYPRCDIAASCPVRGLALYWRCLARIRAFDACVAFNIEEDSVADRLTQLSAARFRLGCSPQRHRRLYHHVLPVEFVNRPSAQAHRWYSFMEVFSAFGMPQPERPTYLDLRRGAIPEACRARLATLGVKTQRRIVVLHPGATKDYKRWPLQHFAHLALMLINSGYLPVIIGAGESDRIAATVILRQLESEGQGGNVIDLCDRLGLDALAWLLTLSHAVVGNDSGPFHLASALGTPGVVIFGPTTRDIWAPLGDGSVLLQRRDVCEPDCSRRHCRFNYHCLASVSPDDVYREVLKFNKL